VDDKLEIILERSSCGIIEALPNHLLRLYEENHAKQDRWCPG
jgi:hypothetical protein